MLWCHISALVLTNVCTGKGRVKLFHSVRMVANFLQHIVNLSSVDGLFPFSVICIAAPRNLDIINFTMKF